MISEIPELFPKARRPTEGKCGSSQLISCSVRRLSQIAMHGDLFSASA